MKQLLRRPPRHNSADGIFIVLPGEKSFSEERKRKNMEIHGFQKLTLLDFPARTACTVFLAGCNFRCPFCHNSLLVTEKPDACMTDADLAAYLKKRRGLLDGVAITGGEPTLYPGA